MIYLIDGYNLLHALSDDPDPLHDNRSELLKQFSSVFSTLNIRAIFVFDAHYTKDSFSRSYSDPIEIVYSAYRQNADDCILELLRGAAHIKAHTVVTSDNKLAREASDMGAKTLSISTFLSFIEKQMSTHSPPSSTPQRPLPKHIRHPDFSSYLKIFTERYEQLHNKKKL